MVRALTLLGLLIALHGSPVAAQMACGDRAAMVGQLSRIYGEARKGAGLAGPSVFELWVSCLTGSWTILQTYPNGRACIMAIGQNWHGVACPLGTPV